MPRWTAAEIAALLPEGQWLVPAPGGLTLAGASIYLPTWREEDIVFLRREGEKFGIPPKALRESATRPRLLITSGPAEGAEADAVLQVPNKTRALFRLAHAARKRITAPVIGVTGSAGKTSTTALIAHCLGSFGPVYRTRVGANVPRGVAWNLACAAEEDRHVVLELAIGGMRDNAALARPDVAVFTNIHAAHLIYHHDLRTIAERKALIFKGMRPGGKVILNSAMNERDYLADRARALGLDVLFYGRRPGDAVRPVAYSPDIGLARIAVGDQLLDLPDCLRHGEHMLLNFLAAAATHLALGLSLNGLAAAFAGFAALPGRGASYTIPHQGGSFTLLDHSYNANPASMRVALAHLKSAPAPGRRIAILGAMAELADQEEAEHARLINDLAGLGLDRVYTLGSEYGSCAGLAGHQALTDVAELEAVFEREVAPGDVVLVKGSNSTGLNAWIAGFVKQRL